MTAATTAAWNAHVSTRTSRQIGGRLVSTLNEIPRAIASGGGPKPSPEMWTWSGTDQRYGGAYCRPPSVHSAFRPRSMPIAAVRLRSKISP